MQWVIEVIRYWSQTWIQGHLVTRILLTLRLNRDTLFGGRTKPVHSRPIQDQGPTKEMNS